MSLNRDRLLNSLGGFWDDGVDRVCDVADNLERDLRKKGKHARRRAKRSYRDGRNQVVTLEETIAGSVRKNPSIFLAIGLLIVAVVLGKVLMGSSCCSSRKSHDNDW